MVGHTSLGHTTSGRVQSSSNVSCSAPSGVSGTWNVPPVADRVRVYSRRAAPAPMVTFTLNVSSYVMVQPPDMSGAGSRAKAGPQPPSAPPA
ncbi:MAG: hypothetical protein IPG17_29595 [Sandaracinaceae bacterium]|nr:hypothetical protein [Sandaracinaceae bacterium]